MLRALFAAGCVYSAAAFSGSLTLGGSALRSRVRGATTSARPAAGNLKMQAESFAPVNIFADMPAKAPWDAPAFSREAEVKHGRIAMLAAVGYPVAEIVHPILAEAANMPNFLTEGGAAPNLLNGGLLEMFDPIQTDGAPVGLFILFFELARTFAIEKASISRRNNFLSKNPEERFPYDLGFDPLGFYAKATAAQREVMAEKELNNARLAMLAITAYPFIEMITSPVGVITSAAAK